VTAAATTAAATTTTTTTVATDAILLRTHVEYIDTANCCTASWHVDWTIQIFNEITALLSGTVQVHTHYYENFINSQMQCQLELSQNDTISLQEEKVNSIVAQFEKSSLSYAEKLVTKLVQHIIRKEQEFYITMTDHILSNNSDSNHNHSTHNDIITTTSINDQLRALRRILPITKNKFQWNYNSHSTRQQQQTNIQLILMQQQQQHLQMNRNKKK
jgi:hypothetical protein